MADDNGPQCPSKKWILITICSRGAEEFRCPYAPPVAGASKNYAHKSIHPRGFYQHLGCRVNVKMHITGNTIKDICPFKNIYASTAYIHENFPDSKADVTIAVPGFIHFQYINIL